MKKNNLLFIVVMVVSVFSNSLTKAQWVQTNGPCGGNINALIFNGTNLFAGTGSGISLSTDNGSSWASVNSGLNNLSIFSLAVSGTNIFAGTYEAVFLSTNNGSSWTSVSNGLTLLDIMYVQALAVSGNNVFAGTQFGGLFRSTNNGTNWTKIGLGALYANVTSLAVKGDKLFVGTGEGIYLTTDNGTTWASVNPNLTYPPSVYSIAVSGENLFAGTSNGLFLTTNNGEAWTQLSSGLPANSPVDHIVVDGTNIIACSENGIYHSTDNGYNWSFFISSPYNTNIKALALNGDNIFAGTYGFGVSLTTLNSPNWIPVSNGIMNTDVRATIMDGGNLFAGTYGGGVFLSTDNGENWSWRSSGLTNMYILSFAGSGNNLFAGTNGGVFLSTNNGLNWTSVSNSNMYVKSLAVNGSNIFAATSEGIFLSTNNGTSWTAISSDLPLNTSVYSLALNGTNLFAGTSNGIFLSANNGSSWAPIYLGLSIYSFAVRGTNIFAGTNSSVYLSTDNGTNWAPVNTGLINSVKSLAISGTNIFAGTDKGVYLSTNNGTNWTSVSYGLPSNTSVSSLCLGGVNLFAGSFRGVWRRPLSEMIIPPGSYSLFSFKEYLFDVPSTLSAGISSITFDRKQTIQSTVEINGVDTRPVISEFLWDWGDFQTSRGYFPQTHTYIGRNNYNVRIISYYAGGERDTAEVLVRFSSPNISVVPLPDVTCVHVPNENVVLSSRDFPGYKPPSLTFFDDSFFSIDSFSTIMYRSTLEYILSVAASIQMEFVNNDAYKFNSKFEQYMLRDPNFSGAYSIWYSNPVAFGAENDLVSNGIDYSSLFHEMGHNFTLNTPSNYYYGGRIDGNANAIYSETLAQIFQHATGYEIVNNYASYGLSEDFMLEIKQSVIETIKVLRSAYENYLSAGKPFSSWNNPSTEADETFGTFMTIAFKFCEHAENSGVGYMQPLKRVMHLLQSFSSCWKVRYDHWNNTTEAAKFRSTLMVTALSYAFETDLRNEFRSLNFPVDDQIYNELYNTPVPVELAEFNCYMLQCNSVRLNWKTITEVNNYGFDVERTMTNDGESHSSIVNGQWEKIGFVQGSGNSNSPKNYSFTDNKPGSGKVAYRLKQIDINGDFKYSNVVMADLLSPGRFDLSQNYPNPFNPLTTISYQLSKFSHTTLKVYDVLGNVVATLVNEEKPAGTYEVTWNAGNLSSGVYFYQLKAGNFLSKKKMVLLK